MGAPLTHAQRDDANETAYLARLGERVRRWRTEHGLTRRALALASGVSERYLAQLEAGHGNMSVLLLRKVAQAMRVAIEELVREHDGAPRRARVALLGLRGAGKSALGEIGYLPTTEPLATGPTANPWDLALSPGGSSGGSAAAMGAVKSG